MVNKYQKLWVRYERIISILGYFITLLFAVPILIFCFSCLTHSGEIDNSVQIGIKLAVQNGLKWCAIIMPIILIVFTVWFVLCSDRVEFTDDSILYYRSIFTKKPSRRIFYDNITECVFCDGLWKHQRKYINGRKIRIYNKNKIILILGLHYKLCLAIVLFLNDKKIRVVGDNGNLKTIDNHYNINFSSLSQEQQITLLKHYCKRMNSNQRHGKKLLKI